MPTRSEIPRQAEHGFESDEIEDSRAVRRVELIREVSTAQLGGERTGAKMLRGDRRRSPSRAAGLWIQASAMLTNVVLTAWQ